jgi:HD-like signal output (HDOD) protein
LPGPQEILRQLYMIAFDDTALDAAAASSRSEHAGVVAASVARLRTIESQAGYAPRRPELLPQLLQAIQDESSLRAMARIIAKDPALTGSLLRIANSPLYRVSAKPIESIERAVSMIGTQGIRAITAAALMQPVMPTGGVFGKFPEIIWEHTLFAAAAAEAHAAMVGDSDPFAAQMLGLLQGLGSIIVFRVARDQYEAQPQITPDASVIAALLDTWSGSTARRIAASWSLSERIHDALHDQLLEATPELLTPLGQSLRFGRMAGALAMLVSAGHYDEQQALAVLGGGIGGKPPIDRIWERLRKAKP